MKVLFFAQAAQAAGCREEDWSVDHPMTVEEFWQEAIKRHPALADLRLVCRLASGMNYLGPDDKLDPTQDAAVLPPVSGG